MLARPRDALLAAAACAAALAAGWVLTFHLAVVRRLDIATLQGFVDLRRPRFDPFVGALAGLGDAAPVVLLALALMAWAVARGRPRLALVVPLVLIGAELTTQVLKPLLADPRVCNCLGDARVGEAWWPSGHATGVMALAMCGVVVAPPRLRSVVGALGAAAAVGSGYALMTMGWHYPSDVLGGFVTAAMWTLLGVAGLRAADARWPARAGREAAARLGRELAPPLLLWALAGAAVLAVVALRPRQALDFAEAHTAFVAGAAAVAAAGAALASGLALVLRR